MSPRTRLWLFRLLALVGVPTVLLAGFEGLLRVGGVGRPVTFLIPDEQPGFLRTNPDYLSRYLPGSFDLRPLNFRVATKKPAGTLRVVVLGESAAQGIPDPMFGFAQHLRAQLRARHPDRRIEVINTGVVAINSHVVRALAREMARHEPDLFVVYLGNNEVVGPYAPGCSYLSDMPPRWVIRLSLAMRSTRTGQLLGQVLGRIGRGTVAPAEWGGMAMFVDTAVRGDDPRLEKVYANFAANLDDIIAAGTEAGAKVVLGTVVSNLKDSPPFLSLNRPDLAPAQRAEWERAFARGRLEWMLGQSAAARASLMAAWALDSQHAETAWLLGQVELEAGRVEPARKHFLEAQRWDALRFRPDPRLNEIIRAAVLSRDSGASAESTRGAGGAGTESSRVTGVTDESTKGGARERTGRAGDFSRDSGASAESTRGAGGAGTEFSRDSGVTLVDTARLLGSDPTSTGVPAGRELLFEHVHFNWEGNYRVGLALAAAAEGALGLGGGKGEAAQGRDPGAGVEAGDPRRKEGRSPQAMGDGLIQSGTHELRNAEAGASVPEFPVFTSNGAEGGGLPVGGGWLSSEEAAAALGYTAHARANLLRLNSYIVQQPPFSNQVTYPEDQARLARDLAAAQAAARSPAALAEAEAALQAAVAADPENPFLAKLLQEVKDDRGDLAGAVAELRRGQALQPENFALRTDEAIKLGRLGRFEEAERFLREAYDHSPPRDRQLMLPAFTDFFVRSKRIADGRAFLSQALPPTPVPPAAGRSAAKVLVLRARLARMAGDHAAAESDLRAARAADPRNAEALDGLVLMLNESGRAEEADKEVLLAAVQQPGNHANNLRAALVAEARGDESASISALGAALRSGPVNSGLALRLARQLHNSGQPDEALRYLATALRLARLEGDAATAEQIARLIGQVRAG